MSRTTVITPLRILLPTGIGTALSLFGDVSLYTVLPTHLAEAGIAFASVGILLSANRWIRLVLNGPMGIAYDRWPRRYLFVPALFIGAFSTALYALAQGFWPLFVGRLLWGLAWAGIWVGGNTIVLDVSAAENRGRWVGIYQISFFVGAGGGAFLGGLLTDLIGYHQTMGVGAFVTFVGAVVVLLFLPETRILRSTTTNAVPSVPAVSVPARSQPPASTPTPGQRADYAATLALLGVNRLVVAGMFMATFSIYMAEQFAAPVQLANRALGVTTLTGVMLSINSFTAMAAAPVMGSLSDRLGKRWLVATIGLLPGIAGFACLVFGTAFVALLGVPLMAISSGSSTGLATTLMGDQGVDRRHSRRLGVLYTVGDLASAAGPLLAIALLPWLGIQTIYVLAVALFAAMLLVALQRSTHEKSRVLLVPRLD